MTYAQALASLTDASKKISHPSLGSKYVTRNFQSATISLVLHDGPASVENWSPSYASVLTSDWATA